MLSWFGTASKKMAAHPKAAAEDQHMLNIATELNGSKQQRTQADTFYNGKDFAKKLRWLVTNPPKDSERWRITPEMASVMLQWNDRNRPISPLTVKRYADAVAAGRWHYTGEPIIFSNQRLIDGQHRLMGCVAANEPIEALVVFGAPDEAFAFIDVGLKRSASHVFSINGVKNAAQMAAATAFIVNYERGAAKAHAGGTGRVLDHEELYIEYLRHPDLPESQWVASMFGNKRMAPPTIMCAVHYLCAKKSRAQADEFFRKVAEGIGFTGKRDPAYKLHRNFIDAAVAQQRVGPTVAAALAIKAWNAMRRGRDVGSLKFEADEAFPRII